MSQIKLTLTAEHYDKIQQQARVYYPQECIANPLTLTFELPDEEPTYSKDELLGYIEFAWEDGKDNGSDYYSCRPFIESLGL